MDSENTNNACYADELRFVVQLITALETLVEICEKNPVRYPDLVADVICLLYGRVIRDDNVVVFVNGLIEQIEEMYDTMDILEREVNYELRDSEEG